MWFGTADPFYALIAMRLAFVLYSVLAVALLSRAKTPRSLDTLIFAWALASALALAFVALNRPPGYLGHLVLDAIAVFFLAAVIPNQLRFQVASAASMAIGILVVAVLQGLTRDPPVATMIWASFPLAVLFGGFVSWDSHISRRRLYAAMMEVQSLRGMIPMCSRCRRVRDDEGFWGRVEEYLAEHTDIEFTHGYCPECYTTVTQDLR